MSDNIKENKIKIKQLRDQIIDQLKNSPWTPSGSDDFYNKHFSFRNNSGGHWTIKFNYSEYNSSDYILLKEFLSPIYFFFLRVFYVNPKLRNYEKIKREEELAKMSQKFFNNKKELVRDAKLNQLLDK